MGRGFCDFCQMWHSASCCHPGNPINKSLVPFGQDPHDQGYKDYYYMATTADDLLNIMRDQKKVIKEFLDKYDKIEPAVNGAFFMAANHGQPYTGDNWNKELKALRELVKDYKENE